MLHPLTSLIFLSSHTGYSNPSGSLRSKKYFNFVYSTNLIFPLPFRTRLSTVFSSGEPEISLYSISALDKKVGGSSEILRNTDTLAKSHVKMHHLLVLAVPFPLKTWHAIDTTQYCLVVKSISVLTMKSGVWIPASITTAHICL